MSSKIEWTDETWNPVTGCSKISPGCQNCYAERMAKRLQAMGNYPDGFDVTVWPERLKQPLRWRKPRRVFVCSMGDLFHKDVPASTILDIWHVMEQCPQHTFQVLTKRPERMRDVLGLSGAGLDAPPLPNVWLGVTAENQECADKRIPILLECPAAVRFVSVEPMLGPVCLPDDAEYCEYCGYEFDRQIKDWGQWLEVYCGDCQQDHDSTVYGGGLGNGSACIGWVIIGCESGPKRRPCKLEWVRDLVEQCREASVAPFNKQVDLGGRVSKDPAEWPADLRVQEYPKTKTKEERT